jgi:hypothetical protein
MADVWNSEVDAIPSPFSLSQQWVMISKHSHCNYGNKGMWFTVEQKGHKGIVGLMYEVR